MSSSHPIISIINLGMGNIYSVSNAFKNINVGVNIVNNVAELKDCDGIVLPGVGNFRNAMNYLKERNFIGILNHLVIEKKIPFLGICLGMQLLMEIGEEGGLTEGLGWFRGKVLKFASVAKLRFPHIGWDDVTILDENNILFRGIQKNPSFYFVHGYYVEVQPSFSTSTCNYGRIFSSSIQKDNIFGVQFHPEKSQKNGIKLLDNFYKYVKEVQK